MSIGGEARPYFEWYRNEDWGEQPGDDGYLLQRYMLHADLHLGRHVRLFGQLKSGLQNGRHSAPRPPDEDRLDAHQAFAEVRFDVAGERSLAVRAGRQEFNFGSGRLVSMREGPNVRQSFDGVRLTLRERAWRVDAFAVKPVATKPDVFDDRAISGQSFWGVYAVRPLAPLVWLPKKGNVDLYYFGLDKKAARFNQGVAREQRQTIGARWWSRSEPFDYNYELVYQFGKFGRGDIRAWTVASENGYTFARARFRPRVGIKANVTSGDKDPNDPDLQTFNPLFPRGAYFGQLVSIGPLNHRDLHPSLDLKLARAVALTADWVFYWRQSLRDGVYGIPGNLLRTGLKSQARFAGHQPGVEINWQFDRHTTFTLNYARFFTGRFLRETPPGRNTTYIAVWATYKF